MSELRLEYGDFMKNADRDIRVNAELLNKKANICDMEDLESKCHDKFVEINKKMTFFALKEESSKRFN